MVSWDSLLLAGFRSQVPLGFKGEEKQGKFDSMGLFVGTARLNACHSLTDQLCSAESLISVDQHFYQTSSHSHKRTHTQKHTYTDAHLTGLLQLTWTIYFYCTIPDQFSPLNYWHFIALLLSPNSFLCLFKSQAMMFNIYVIFSLSLPSLVLFT